jgi:outer membrane protein assembly factor BamB
MFVSSGERTLSDHAQTVGKRVRVRRHFSGDVSGNVIAFRTRDGATLWHKTIRGLQNAPIAYELNDKEYVGIGRGNSLYAFSLK